MSAAFEVACLATGFEREIQQVVQVDLLRTRELGRAKLCPLSLCYLISSSASLAKYADPVADLLDKWGAFRARLFRESCVFHRGNYVKDLSRLGRDLRRVLILDNSPASYVFHPDNAVPVASWFDNMSDTELQDLLPFFEQLSRVEDVYSVLRQPRPGS